MSIETTLQQRGDRYGSFEGHADITQSIKAIMTQRPTTNWHHLPDAHKEALEMIAHKIGRILNGDPNYADNWHDIAGYATLVEQVITNEKAATH